MRTGILTFSYNSIEVWEKYVNPAIFFVFARCNSIEVRD